jgi:AAA domain
VPFKSLTADAWKQGLQRTLVVGPPGARKTTSLLTWPGPIGIVVAPGEKGYASITVGDGIKAFYWEDDIIAKTSPSALVKEIETVAFDLLAGKYGEITTFALDGLHKIYTAYINDATSGAFAAGEDFEPRMYGRAHEMFLHFISRIAHSPVLYFVATVWDGREADNPDLGSKGPTHIYPDLPGKLAKRIMGEFSVVLYAEVPAPVAGIEQKATWQLQPGGKIWGAGVKVPPVIARTLPAKVPQNWQALEPLLLGQPITKEIAK